MISQVSSEGCRPGAHQAAQRRHRYWSSRADAGDRMPFQAFHVRSSKRLNSLIGKHLAHQSRLERPPLSSRIWPVTALVGRSQRAIACEVRRHPRYSWHSRQCGFCNLQNLKDPPEFESHSLRQFRSRKFPRLFDGIVRRRFLRTTLIQFAAFTADFAARGRQSAFK